MKLPFLSALLIIFSINSAYSSFEPSRFTEVYKKVAKSVVTILVTTDYAKRGLGNPFMDMPEFRNFFEFFGGPGYALPRHQIEQSMGSGVIISKEGLVLTCAHVVRANDKVVILTSDNLFYEADVLLLDEEEDLALLKIKTSGEAFNPAIMGDSDNVIEGEEVAALGNPVGVGLWFTQGIISSSFNTHGGGNFIGTSAMVNPGNSGGGLFNLKGELIALPSAIKSRTGMSHGINFAVPVNLAKALISSYEQKKKTFERPQMLAKLQSIDGNTMKVMNLKTPQGALIVNLANTSPFKSAGLQKADVIISFNNYPISSPEQLLYRVKLVNFGQKVPLQFLREGKEYKAEVTFSEIKEETLSLSSSPFEGTTLKSFSPEDENGKTFVMVESVKRGSKAERLGIEKGAVILALNGTPLSNPKQLEEIVRQSKNYFDIVTYADGIQRRITIHE